MGDGVEADQQTNHERVRRELWAAIYRQAHEATANASALRVEPEFRWAEAADRALTQFDKRFSAAGATACDPACRGNDSESYCVRTNGAYCGVTNPNLASGVQEVPRG